MSSRAEEKQARRREREAQEQAAAKSAGNKRRLQIVAGAVLGLALVGAILAVVLGGGGGKGNDPKKKAGDAKAPTANIADFNAAVKASGCAYKAVPPTGGGEHTGDPVKYGDNPPSSGPHNPQWAEAGIYEPGNEPQKEKWVHSLEHGRIVLTYKPGTPKTVITALEGVFNEPLLGTPGYQKQVFQNNTKMPYEVAALAWGQKLTCKTITNAPATYDAMRAFATRFVNKAPEEIP
jgi:hypothetical protein